MNLDEVHDRYFDASRRVSEIARQLAFVGVAIVWLFSGGAITKGGTVAIVHGLRWPGALLVLALLVDFLHATYQAGLWGIVGKVNERRGTEDDITIPTKALWPATVGFWLKLALLGAAYVLLAIYFVSKVT